jgi:radical SAM superfamily enzyme YgiQ (UPF0313 family)
MRLILLYNNFLPEVHWNCLKAQEKNMGAIPPLNLCYIAALARKCGHEVTLIDLQIERLSFTELIEKITAFKPDLMGFTITTYLFHPMLEWIKNIKAAVKVPVIVGGFHLSLYPHETMAHPVIDLGIIGSAFSTLKLLLENYGDCSQYYFIPGLCFRDERGVHINPVNKDEKFDFDAMPFPARDLIRNDQYGNFICVRKNFTAMLTGTGCPFRCKYCASTLSHCIMRSAGNVTDEIEECYEKYGVREIDFYDQSFTIDRKRTLMICDEIIKRKIDIIWTIRTRADLIDKELLEAMKTAGLTRIMYGIESGDQGILDRLNKNESLEKVKSIVKLTKKYGINMLGFFMLGCPGETAKTLQNTFRLALSLPFDDIQATRFTLFPGTRFYEEYLSETGEPDYWAQYTLDQKNARKLPLFDTAFTPQEIERDVKKLFLKFYLRFSIIFRRIVSGNLIFHFGRHLKALVDMLTS